jgi:hypothetical protein
LDYRIEVEVLVGVAVVVAVEALVVVVEALAAIAEVVVADEVVSAIVDVGEDEEEVHAQGVLPLMRARKRPFS